jgi:iron complex transport system ATP-binding protein
MLIDIRRYSFGIGRTEILKDISLDVREGEYVSIVGPNGAGKTTLLKCLNRILTGGRGSIVVAGKRLEDYSQRELAKLMSYVPQADGRLSPFTVNAFVMMGRYPHLSPFSTITKQDTDAVREALELTGTVGFAERPLRTLSGGERQKVYIAAALAQGARILLLDEPTTFLDPRHQADIQLTLQRVNRDSGVTVLSATHDINDAVRSSRRVVGLKHGSVAFCLPVERIMTGSFLRDLYGKAFLFLKHPQTGKPIAVPEQ